MTAVTEQLTGTQPAQLTSEGAWWIWNALRLDEANRRRNGVRLPACAGDVLEQIAAVITSAEGQDPPRPVIGPRVATIKTSGMVAVSVAASTTGVGPEYVRRLARTGRIRCHRLGSRTWLIDLESLESVLANSKRTPAS